MCPCNSHIFAYIGVEHHFPRRALGATINRSRHHGRFVLTEEVERPVVLGATPGKYGSVAAAGGERAEQLQGGCDPVEIVRGRPERPRYGIPGKMQQMVGTQSTNDRY